jgi:hypothetical protein
MYRDYKIVAVTPAGRKCYLELLIPQLMRYVDAGVLDEYHLWVNTVDKSDITYMEQVASELPNIIKLHRLPTDVKCMQNMSIYSFFKNAVDDNTVYVRFDDDIVYIDTVHAFKQFLDFRIDHPQYFMVYANILNNALIAHVLQRKRKLNLNKGFAEYQCMDPVGWKDGPFAANLHDQVLEKLTSKQGLEPFHFSDEWFLYHRERVSINCLAWIGHEFRKQCGGIVERDEEKEIATTMPLKLHLHNTIFGGFCVVHYAFHTQRDYCNKMGYYERYQTVVRDQLNSFSTYN